MDLDFQEGEGLTGTDAGFLDPPEDRALDIIGMDLLIRALLLHRTNKTVIGRMEVISTKRTITITTMVVDSMITVDSDPLDMIIGVGVAVFGEETTIDLPSEEGAVI